MLIGIVLLTCFLVASDLFVEYFSVLISVSFSFSVMPEVEIGRFFPLF